MPHTPTSCGLRPVAAGDKFYLIAFNAQGPFGCNATLTPTFITPPATIVADVNNNETAATGQVVTGPIAQFDGRGRR